MTLCNSWAIWRISIRSIWSGDVMVCVEMSNDRFMQWKIFSIRSNRMWWKWFRCENETTEYVRQVRSIAHIHSDGRRFYSFRSRTHFSMCRYSVSFVPYFTAVSVSGFSSVRAFQCSYDILKFRSIEQQQQHEIELVCTLCTANKKTAYIRDLKLVWLKEN